MSDPIFDPRRRQLIQAAAGSLLLAVSPLSFAGNARSQIIAIRSWPSATYTRITLETNTTLKFKYFTIKNPERLVVDIEGVTLNAVLRDISDKMIDDDPYVRAARAAQFNPTTVRLVFDLKTEVKPEVFTIAPVSEYRHRLVIDLFPKQSNDPLLALLNDFNNGRLDSKNDAPPPQAKNDKNHDEDKPAASKNKQKDTRNGRPFTIMIDPGHGGEDPGAIGPSGAKEKTVVLAIARKLKKMVDGHANMRALMTRDADIFIPLGVRVAKARQAKADLFISIHADAFIQASAKGSSVFTLSDKGASSSAAKWLAKTQNDADLVGGVKLDTKDRYLAHTLLDLTQTATLNDSVKLAGSVLKELGEVNRLHRNQVEQASFAVLKAPDIPSILVETAFISNPEEEARLINANHQEKIADAIFSGLKSYANKIPILAKG